MDIQVNILFKNVVEDTDPNDVLYRLQCCANEWFYPEVTPTMPEISIAPPIESVESVESFESLDDQFTEPVHQVQPQPVRSKQKISQPIFVVSDLHLGDRGVRDNFVFMSEGRRMQDFTSFLNYVERQNGRLIIAGDLFELWQSNVSRVLTARPWLLNRLASMGAIYILGNHDADLVNFRGHLKLTHPFFRNMVTSHTETIGGKQFHFIHGHEVDRYCANDTPGLGRISAIYTGLREDRNGGPLVNKYQTIENRSLGRIERILSFVRWILRKPNRAKVMNSRLIEYLDKYDVLVSGHTHRAGQLYRQTLPLQVYNTGTWAENICSFVLISPHGDVGVYDWDGDNILSKPNFTGIEV